MNGAAPLLVTGGAGWLGSALVDRLSAAGVRVRCLEHLRPAPASAHERVRGDLRNPGVAAAAVDGCGAVLHLAGLTHGHRAADYRAINVEAAAALARAASKAGVARFVHLSSRTAVPLAQVAHSHENSRSRGRPMTVAPRALGWATAWARALATGGRAKPATATPILSIRRFTIISATSPSTGTGSAATAASCQARSCSRGGVSALL